MVYWKLHKCAAIKKWLFKSEQPLQMALSLKLSEQHSYDAETNITTP